MFDELTLFAAPEEKSQILSVRVSKREKKRINLMAKNKGMNTSRLILALLREENKRQIDMGTIDVLDDGMPF